MKITQDTRDLLATMTGSAVSLEDWAKIRQFMRCLCRGQKIVRRNLGSAPGKARLKDFIEPATRPGSKEAMTDTQAVQLLAKTAQEKGCSLVEAGRLLVRVDAA